MMPSDGLPVQPVKLTHSQRAIILLLLDEENQHEAIRACVRGPSLTRLIQVGAIEVVGELYQVSDAAVVEVRGF